MFSLFKSEAFTTLDTVKFGIAMNALRDERIDFTTKVVDLGGNTVNVRTLGRFGEMGGISAQYYIYVAKKDIEKAQYVIYNAMNNR